MSGKQDSPPPRPEMVKAVDEMLKNLEKLAPDPGVVGPCSELPGIVLDEVLGRVQSHDDDVYKEITRNYKLMRAEYLRALVAHPVGRALALLAVGAEGLAMLEAGRTPCAVSRVSNRPQQSLRSRREPYNCHHVIPKSLQVTGGAAAINHPANLVMTKTVRRGRDQSQNPHHCWHGLLLHPQTRNDNLEARQALAEKSAKQAADWLPAGAFINGSPLPPSHRSKKCLPIIQSNMASGMILPEELKPARKKPRRRTGPGQRIIQEPHSNGSAMPINQRYLTELSDLFTEDLRQSEYYRNLPITERDQLEARIEQEAAAGVRPLLPGATATELAALAQAVKARLGVELPLSLQNILRDIDGFAENAVTLYCVDPDFREDGFDSGPGLLAENEAFWGGLPETAGRYLFTGEADLWFFAFDLPSGGYVALDRHALRLVHRFADAEEMVNDMRSQSLVDSGDAEFQ